MGSVNCGSFFDVFVSSRAFSQYQWINFNLCGHNLNVKAKLSLICSYRSLTGGDIVDLKTD